MNEKSTSAGKSRVIAIIAMFFLFAMISFVTNLAAPLGTIWKNTYSWSGMLGNLMNFAAYLFMGIPAGNLLVKIGYKRTALLAMAVGFVGLVFQWLSSFVGVGAEMFGLGVNFYIYLLGAFVCGFSVCMLNTVVNPMLNLLGGGGKKGNQLVQAGGSLNSLSGTLTPLLAGSLIGAITANTSMTDVIPLLFIAMGVFVFAFLVISAVQIPEPNMRKDGQKVKYSHSPWNFRHCVLGVVGIFLYVGIEVGIPGVLIFFLSDTAVSGLGENAVAVAGSIAAMYWLLMLVGRLFSTVISGAVSSRVQLITVAVVGICLVVAAILTPASVRVSMPVLDINIGIFTTEVPISAMFLVLCGLCTSVMWGGIFNLAVEGLGKYVPQASGIFMMMVVGGGIMPVIQNWLAVTSVYMTRYWPVAATPCYLLLYGLLLAMNVNKDIPVDEESEQEVMDAL